jgi:NAD(P)-dependent dehydrogenase (short-subunit alcohol dehydrogenase family)
MHTKTAVVTGGGSGIGRAAAVALSKDGWRVAVAGRRQEPLEETAREAAVDRERMLCVAADVREPVSVAALFGRVLEKWGRLDLLFNNAGINVPGVPIDELDPADWQRLLETNLTGSFLCAQHAFRIMKSQVPRGGRIINNGSISAYSPRPDSAPYTASKHAITGLTKSLALDGRRHDIVCSQIDIGNAATELTARMHEGVRQADGTVVPEPTFDVARAAEAILHIANLPLDTNILFMTIMAAKMPFVGRG